MYKIYTFSFKNKLLLKLSQIMIISDFFYPSVIKTQLFHNLIMNRKGKTRNLRLFFLILKIYINSENILLR